MSAVNTQPLLAQLPEAESIEPGVWSAVPVPKTKRFWLCRNNANHVAVMIDWYSTETTGSVRAWKVGQVQHCLPRAHRVKRKDIGTTEDRTLGALIVASDEQDRHQAFLTLVTELLVEPLEHLPDDEQDQWLIDAITGLRNLFHQHRTPSEDTVVGLWGELLVLSKATDVPRAALAWHNNPERVDDFRDGPHRVEVKTTLGDVRAHNFRLNQLIHSSHVCSVWAERSEKGSTIEELMDHVCVTLSDAPPEAAKRIRMIVYTTLGVNTRGWPSVAGLRLHLTSRVPCPVAFYDSAQVPSVRPDNGVDSVSFCSDLSGATALTMEQLESEGGLLQTWRLLGCTPSLSSS